MAKKKMNMNEFITAFKVGSVYSMQDFLNVFDKYNLSGAGKRLSDIVRNHPGGIILETYGRGVDKEFKIVSLTGGIARVRNKSMQSMHVHSEQTDYSVSSFIKDVSPIVRELNLEGKKNAATISISNVLYCSCKLKRFLKLLGADNKQ